MVLSQQQINGYIERAAQVGTEVHSFIYQKNGEILAESTISPYKPSDKVLLYSLSKTFTAVLFGIAVDEGLISDSTKTTALFADKCPDVISPLLAEQTFAHLLSMTCGHGECYMLEMIPAPDCVQLYLQKPLVYKPGERFVYSTASTCVCAAAIERVAGMPFMEYANQKLFAPLGIEKPFWEVMSDGSVQGGTGLHLNARDVLKLANMLANKGVYGGKRIVSEAWINKMTASYSRDDNSPLPDWHSGYGYQVWHNSRGGYRGDGAYGQLMVIIPERKTIFVQLAEATNMQEEMNCVFELLDGVTYERPTNDFYTPPATAKFVNMTLKCQPNPADVKMISIKSGDELEVSFDGNIMRCGNGKFVENSLRLKNITPKINGYSGRDGDIATLYAAYKTDGQTLELIIRHADCVHSATWRFSFDADNFTISIIPRTGAPICNTFCGEITRS